MIGRARSSAATAWDMFAYRLMPHGLRGLLTTVFWPPADRFLLQARPDRTAYPVEPGRRYRLSRSLWRVSEDDNVYLDFDDGLGQGGNFADAQATASRTQAWERIAAEATVGPETVAIKVRCVRDGANRANAYCDGISLQRLD